MAITPKEIQALREATGAGMMDCKKALVETEGDMDKAIDILRKKGIATAEKKSGRIAAEGACYAAVCESCGSASIVEINSETDFSAKSDAFQAFIKGVTEVIYTENPKDVDELKQKLYLNTGRTVGETLQDKILAIGENIQIRRLGYYGDAVNAAYVHMGGKIAVLVHMDTDDGLKNNPAVVELGREVAMQIAAMRPLCLDRSALRQEDIDKEREIYAEQLKQDPKNSSKPAAVLEKIVDGRIGKYYSEVCLLEQAFVKDNKLTVGKYVEQKAKELGGKIVVTDFVRFEKGEGLAKREDDFAAEVARMQG